MPELSAALFAVFAVLFGVGVLAGWLFRGDRCAREKIAVNAGWQEQFEAQQAETRRLSEQNRGLMQQINQHQASEKDLSRRCKELATSLKAAIERRDELQRQVKDVRSNLETALQHRTRLQTDMRSRDVRNETTANALREKDNKIFKLSRELTSWQNRVPPLVEKYRERELEMKELQFELEQVRERNREIDDLQNELSRARDRIIELETRPQPEHTRIEPIDTNALGRGLDASLDASNEQFNESTEPDLADLQDQIADGGRSPLAGNGRYGLEFLPERAHAPSNVTQVRDDLKAIKGVGPAIERTLNDLGFYCFEQIASISEFDINRIAERLKGFRSRIYREDWIGQARILHYQKRNDGPPA
ncbi:MAG: hypothetical protein WDZ50_02575 [Woeseia sp.]